MSSESSKKRKPKVIRSDGAPAEGKRNRSDTEQVRSVRVAMLLRNYISWPSTWLCVYSSSGSHLPGTTFWWLPLDQVTGIPVSSQNLSVHIRFSCSISKTNKPVLDMISTCTENVFQYDNVSPVFLMVRRRQSICSMALELQIC